MNSNENSLKNVYQDELFLAIGYDNPDSILLRWIRARKWNIYQALEQLNETIYWRHQWGVKKLLENGESDLNLQEISLGKTFFMGYDLFNRPINYVSVKEHIKGQFPSESTEKLTVFTMETGIKLLKIPNESVTVIFDLNGFGLKNMDFQHVKFLIKLLENYYPESLSLGLIINAPWIFNRFWFIIKQWLDPNVQSKIHFLNNMNDLTKYIDPSNLTKKLNGTKPDFIYIPPTDNDLIMLNTFRNDKKGKLIAEEQHKKAVEEYLNITFQWVFNNNNNDLLEQRSNATIKLKNSFEQLVPYIHTKTYYHRNGYIYEPIFDIIYQKIINNQQ